MKITVSTKMLTAVFGWVFALSCIYETAVPDKGDDMDNGDACLCSANDHAVVLQVGADKPFKTVKEAAAAAGNNTVIEIDAGTYRGDVVSWTQDSLVIRSSGGEVILDADGKNIKGVGIWEMNGGTVCVEGITFVNAKVADRNGAGIRLTKGNLTVVNCHFLRNETGILTANTNTITLTVKDCEFGYNGYGDGYSHNLYAGYIGSLYVSGSHFHHANVGHLLKSRAALNQIYYNLIADGNGAGSKASYEIDIPSGGQAVIVGNIIQKSSTPENPYVISFAKESSDHYPNNQIYLCYNTILGSRTAGDRVLNAPLSVTGKYVLNNAILESITFDAGISLTAEKGNVFFKTEEILSYYPVAAALESWKSQHEKGIDSHLPQSLKLESISLVPRYQYKPPLGITPLDGEPLIPGAVHIP
ncbi:MAG: hypothetical protein LBQ73_08160 [Tannerellaceae bacterium]|jgi:hypothetical protein|nr:hypothetical protein [Tannerellaceae bacterium]